MTDLNSGIGQVGNAAENAVENATETASKAQGAASGAGSAVTGATDKLKSATSQASTTASGNEAGAPSSDTGSSEEESTAKDTSSQDENTHPEDETPVNVDVNVNVSVLQSSGDPLANLPIQVKTEDGVIHDGFSDADGRLPPLQVSEGARLMFLTKRWDSSLKEIGGITVGSTPTSVCLVSPGFLVPVKTEANKGTPGDSEAKIPKYNKQTDDGELKYAEDLKPATSASAPSAKPAAAQPASAGHQATSPANTSGHNGAGAHGASANAGGSHPHPHGPAVEPSASQAAPVSAQKKTAAPSKKEYPKSIKPAVPKDTAPASSKPMPGRDKDGKPLAVIEDKHKDEHDAWTWSGFWHFLTGHSKPQSSGQGTSGSADSASSASSSSSSSSSKAAASSSSSSSKAAGGTAGASSSASNAVKKASSSASSHQSSSSSTATTSAAGQTGSHSSAAKENKSSAPSQKNSNSHERKLSSSEVKSAIEHEQDVRDQLNSLFEICRKVITYDFDGETNASVINSIRGNRFTHQLGEKPKSTSLWTCYKYVKVSLFLGKIVDGPFGQGVATLAGPDLVNEGFVEVNDLIDFRCAAAGDVIVYRWSPKEWDKSRKQKKNPKLENQGHIEIRSYDTYYSDFVSPRPQKIQGQYHEEGDLHHEDCMGKKAAVPWRHQFSKFDHIQVYRKIFDLEPTLRIEAFLRCISDCECAKTLQDMDKLPYESRFNMLFSGLPGRTDFIFDDYKNHPWYKKDLSNGRIRPGNGGLGDPAGAYQIKRLTWENYVLRTDYFDRFENNFDKNAQKLIVVLMLEDLFVLDLIRMGNIEEPYNKLKVSTWTSFKSHTYEFFKDLFDRRLNEIKQERLKVGLIVGKVAK